MVQTILWCLAKSTQEKVVNMLMASAGNLSAGTTSAADRKRANAAPY
ncbi:hypothetical protein [Cupriavidus consociatus]|nr:MULTISPECIES: hypothetical protein [unclassified Cupriavidus]MDK2657625.1 hypothetical protein [Cupriavidus sp. LEh21]